MVAGSKAFLYLSIFLFPFWVSPTFGAEPVIYLDPSQPCSASVMDNDNWNALYAAAVFSESVLWTRAGVAFRDHPKIDGNSVVDTISQLRSLCRNDPGLNTAELIESFVVLWQDSSATQPSNLELEACTPIDHWHKRGPALAMPQEANLYLTHRDSGAPADGKVHVFYEPRARCSLLLFSSTQSGWPFTANLYALGAKAARDGQNPALSQPVTSTTIEQTHAWTAQCQQDESLPFNRILENSMASAGGIGFVNGADGFQHVTGPENSSECPYAEDGEASEPIM